jgi:L-aspartate oxidase
MAVDLITKRKLGQGGEDRCLGAYVLDVGAGEIHTFLGRVVMLATGGAGKIYLYTSNPDVATADGIAMAWRAGATVANMEFFQFHPTCLFHRDARALLITEACRGEGGKLRRLDGTPFMENYHPMGDLAPRDVVARAIDEELKRTGEEHVALDLTHLEASFLLDRFPGVAANLAPLGIDITTTPIPVVPAAHYCCGGVDADMWGRTSLAGLLVSGETAHTGVHGANRLASNSLLEAMVISDLAASIADEVMASELPADVPVVPDWNPGLATDTDEGVLVSHGWDAIRRVMWNYVGIVRSNERLRRARRRLDLLQEEILTDYWRFRLTPDLIELRNIATAASLVVDCARMRKESRGLHYTLDYPTSDDAHWLRPTLLRPGIRG